MGFQNGRVIVFNVTAILSTKGAHCSKTYQVEGVASGQGQGQGASGPKGSETAKGLAVRGLAFGIDFSQIFSVDESGTLREVNYQSRLFGDSLTETLFRINPSSSSSSSSSRGLYHLQVYRGRVTLVACVGGRSLRVFLAAKPPETSSLVVLPKGLLDSLLSSPSPSSALEGDQPRPDEREMTCAWRVTEKGVQLAVAFGERMVLLSVRKDPSPSSSSSSGTSPSSSGLVLVPSSSRTPAWFEPLAESGGKRTRREEREVVAIRWLQGKVLIVMGRDHLHLLTIDPDGESSLVLDSIETTDLKLRPVSLSGTSSGSAISSTSSMGSMGEGGRTFAQTMVEGQGRVFVMGRDQVVEIVVLPWSDRFHFLLDRSLDVDSALRVLLFLSDVSLHPSLSLSKDDPKALSAAQSLALSRVIDLFISSPSSSPPGSIPFLSSSKSLLLVQSLFFK